MSSSSVSTWRTKATPRSGSIRSSRKRSAEVRAHGRFVPEQHGPEQAVALGVERRARQELDEHAPRVEGERAGVAVPEAADAVRRGRFVRVAVWVAVQVVVQVVVRVFVRVVHGFRPSSGSSEFRRTGSRLDRHPHDRSARPPFRKPSPRPRLGSRPRSRSMSRSAPCRRGRSPSRPIPRPSRRSSSVRRPFVVVSIAHIGETRSGAANPSRSNSIVGMRAERSTASRPAHATRSTSSVRVP